MVVVLLFQGDITRTHRAGVITANLLLNITILSWSALSPDVSPLSMSETCLVDAYINVNSNRPLFMNLALLSTKSGIILTKQISKIERIYTILVAFSVHGMFLPSSREICNLLTFSKCCKTTAFRVSMVC